MSKTTIIDLAKLANVSIATVSNYLNGHFEKMSEATKQRIKKAIENTGYIPSAQAQAMVKKSSGIIAVLILDNTNAWAAQMLTVLKMRLLRLAIRQLFATLVLTPRLKLTGLRKCFQLEQMACLSSPPISSER